MSIISKVKHSSRFIVVFLSLLIAICILVSLYKLYDQKGISYTATQDKEILLTKSYGDDARNAVENFERSWFNLDMHQNPMDNLDSLLIGPLLDYYRNKTASQNSTDWLIPDQVKVLDLRVVDYNEGKMTVVACIEGSIKRVSHNGDVLEQYPVRQIKRLYVFYLDSSFWKVSNFIDITDPNQALQDWDFMPQDLKDFTGDITKFVLKGCKSSVE